MNSKTTRYGGWFYYVSLSVSRVLLLLVIYLALVLPLESSGLFSVHHGGTPV